MCFAFWKGVVLHFELHYKLLAAEQEVPSASRWAKQWWSVLVWRLGCGLCKFLTAFSSLFSIYISALLSSDCIALFKLQSLANQPYPFFGSLLSKSFIFNPVPPHSSCWSLTYRCQNFLSFLLIPWVSVQTSDPFFLALLAHSLSLSLSLSVCVCVCMTLMFAKGMNMLNELEKLSTSGTTSRVLPEFIFT